MNLVKLITDQLSSDAVAKLSSMLGIDRETAEAAITAAVPSLLAGIGGLASKEDGIRKLTTTLGNFDDSMFGNFDRLIGGDANALRQKGGSLLNNLLGDGMTGGIATAISRYLGVGPDTVKSLLAYLAPVVLGRVASQWQNQGGTPAALKNLFVDQKRNIEDSCPAGFSLADVPGLPRVSEVGRSATHAAKQAEASSWSLASTLLPLALLIGGALLLWGFWQGRGEPQQADVKPAIDQPEAVVAMKPIATDIAGIPEAGQFQQQMTDALKSLSATFAEIKDPASAEAAAPRFEELNTKLGAMGELWKRMPEAGRTALNTFVNDQLATVKTQAEKVLSMPGLADRIKTLITEIVAKLASMQSSGAAT